MTFCYDQYKKFPEYFDNQDNLLDDVTIWQNDYVTDVKDFHSSGKVSASLGIPLHQLPTKGPTFKMPDGKEITLAKNIYQEAINNVTDLVSKL